MKDARKNNELNEYSFREGRHAKHIIQNKNVERFRREFPQFNQLTHQQILCIFRIYKKNCNRTFYASNISMLFAGTLVILIASLFMNAGAQTQISIDDKSPN